MIRKQALPHRLGPKNIPIPQVPTKIGSLRSNSSQDASLEDGSGEFYHQFMILKEIIQTFKSDL